MAIRSERGDTLRRRTPLKAGAGLKRTSFQTSAKGKRIRARSARGTAYEAELDAAKVVVHARSGGRCEAGLPGCTGQAAHVHHRARRQRIPGNNAPTNLLDLCTNCHDWAHAHPVLARLAGLIVSAHVDPAQVPLDIAILVRHDDV